MKWIIITWKSSTGGVSDLIPKEGTPEEFEQECKLEDENTSVYVMKEELQ